MGVRKGPHQYYLVRSVTGFTCLRRSPVNSMSDCGYRSLRAGARATALPALLMPGGCGGAPADFRRHRIVVLLRKSLVKAAQPKLLRLSGGGEREIGV